MRKINIGLLLLSNSWGGAEEICYNLARGFDKKKFEVNLLVNEFLYKYYSPTKDVNIINLGPLESNKKLRKIYSIHNIRTALHRFIKKKGINLVHANLENSLLVLGTSAGKLDIPVIFTLAGDETKLYHFPKTLENRFIKLLINRMLIDDNTTVTSVSNWLVKDFDENYKDRIVVIPNGVDCSIFKPLKNKGVSGRNSVTKNTIFYWGRMVEHKGIEDILKVAKELTDYQFAFAGKGPLSVAINSKNTKYLGFKKRRELVKLIAESSICVFPSYSEGMSISGLEAIACGKAIVASDTGFFEYIEEGRSGILVTPGDIKQLKRAIVLLMEDSQKRREIENNARKKALEYDISKSVRAYQDLYREKVKR